MSLRVCAEPDCPTLTTTSRCPEHTRLREQARGSRQDRGYDAEHDRTRRRWAPRVAAGGVRCARCGQPIVPGTPWDLGHNADRTAHTGPEHAGCNRATAGPRRTASPA